MTQLANRELTLSEIDEKITQSTVSAANEIGFFLKQIRDRRLYKEAGSNDVYEYAQRRYGYATSTTSRLMAMNDKFSVDGNSLELEDRYKTFSKSQLMEMLPMSDEQIQAVDPDMTVKKIKEIKAEQKAQKEDPEAIRRPTSKEKKLLAQAAEQIVDTCADWLEEDEHDRVSRIRRGPEKGVRRNRQSGRKRREAAAMPYRSVKSEATEQIRVMQWARRCEAFVPELRLLYHVPNEGKRKRSTAQLLVAEGLRSGVPDLCLPVPRHGYGSLYIEMKYGKGRLSTAQRIYIQELRDARNKVVVCYSAEDAIEVLRHYLSRGDDFDLVNCEDAPKIWNRCDGYTVDWAPCRECPYYAHTHNRIGAGSNRTETENEISDVGNEKSGGIRP